MRILWVIVALSAAWVPAASAAVLELYNNPNTYTFSDGDQRTLGGAYGYDNYDISFDLTTHAIVGSLQSFRMIFDTPTVQYPSWHGGVGVYSFASGGTTNTRGNYGFDHWQDDELMHVSLAIDLLSSEMTMNINDIVLGTASFNHSGDISAMRIVLSGWHADATYNPDVSAVLSNLRIKTSVVPIPAAAWLFGSALAGLGWMRRKQTV